jgi:hypothetical protein
MLCPGGGGSNFNLVHFYMLFTHIVVLVIAIHTHSSTSNK